MSIRLILVLCLYIPHVAYTSNATVSTPTDAQIACDLINTSTTEDLESKLDKSWSENKIKSLKEIIELIQSKGRCLEALNIEKLLPNFDADYITLYLGDDRVVFLRASINPENNKIHKFSFKGFALDPRKVEIIKTNVKTRDGIKLSTFIFKNKNQTAPSEVILERTPYFYTNNIKKARLMLYSEASYYLKQNYIFVYQAIRGTGGSEGIAELFSPIEIQDGADTIRWITKQEFSNGKVASVGVSYNGLTAAATGVENPEGLKLIITGAGPTDSSSGTFNLNGVLTSAFLEYANYFTTGDGQPFTGKAREVLATLDPIQSLDVSNYDHLLYNRKMPEYQKWSEAWKRNDQDFFKSRSFIRELSKIKIPMIFTAGLGQDGNMPDTVNNFLEIENFSKYRENKKLILGMWSHSENAPWDLDGSFVPSEIINRYNKWLSSALRNEKSEVDAEPRVLIQSTTQADKLLKYDSYPTNKDKYVELYFNEDNLLLTEPPGSKFEQSYLYHPDVSKSGSLEYTFTIEDDLHINGNLYFTLYLKNNSNQKISYEDIIISASILTENNEEEPLQFGCNYIKKLKFIKGKSVFTNTACPVARTIKAGQKLKINLFSNLFPLALRSNSNESLISLHSTLTKKSKIKIELE